MATSPDARSEALGRVLELALLIEEDFDRSLAALGMTKSEVRLLWAVAQRGPSTQRTLADNVQVTPRTITAIVDRLESARLVTRQAHPSDRRATLVTLTRSGTRLATKLQRQQKEFADLLFADMDAAKLDRFVAGLDHVLTRLRDAVSGTGP